MKPNRADAPARRAAGARQQALGVALLVVVPLLLYLRVASLGFVQADDTDLIRDNQAFLGDAGNLGEVFTRSYFEADAASSDAPTYYRPLVIASFIADAQLSGSDPAGYHLTNLALHILTVLGLFAFMRTLDSPWLPALLAALLFAVHPANTQTVCWIPGRNDSLTAVFALGSLIALANWLRQDSRLALGLHLATFGAALFTKESALALVPLFLLLPGVMPRLRRRRFSSRSALLGYGVVALAWYIARAAALEGPADGPAVPLAATALANAPHLLLYAGKVALPFHLNVTPGLTWIDALLGAASVVLVGWGFVRCLDGAMRRFAAAWFLLFLFPALLVAGLPAYEHRLYLPLAGVAVAVSQLRIRGERADRSRWTVGASALLTLFAGLTAARIDVFRDPYSYWGSATRGTPHAGLAYVNLGQLYEADGNLSHAEEQYRRALAFDPGTPGAHNNLGVIGARRGELDRAVAHFEAEIARHPSNADAYFNLGLAHGLAGRDEAAVAAWEGAVAADGRFMPALRALADHYRDRGDTLRARHYLERLEALSPR